MKKVIIIIGFVSLLIITNTSIVSAAPCDCVVSQYKEFPSDNGFCVGILNDSPVDCTYCIRHTIRFGYDELTGLDCTYSDYYIEIDMVAIGKLLTGFSCIDIDPGAYECAEHWVAVWPTTTGTCILPPEYLCIYHKECTELD